MYVIVWYGIVLYCVVLYVYSIAAFYSAVPYDNLLLITPYVHSTRKDHHQMRMRTVE